MYEQARSRGGETGHSTGGRRDGEEEEEEEGGWVIIRSPTSNSSRHNSVVAVFVSSAHAKSHGSYLGGRIWVNRYAHTHGYPQCCYKDTDVDVL